MDLDEVLMVPKDSKKPKMSHEEQKAMLDGRVCHHLALCSSRNVHFEQKELTARLFFLFLHFVRLVQGHVAVCSSCYSSLLAQAPLAQAPEGP